MILAGDIKLVASHVMDDVPEGGGAPTSFVVRDGVSNAIFPDVSELDRAGGRVSLRKLHVSVQSDDTDTFMGCNVVVAEPPVDPNVSITLFTTGSTFDRRDAASNRVEAYLNKGPVWGGALLENHIAGQRAIQLIQAPDNIVPNVGHTLCLVQFEGSASEFSQYVRTTDVSYVVRFYPDSNGNPKPMWVVTCQISDALRYDFVGVPGGIGAAATSNSCLVRDTVVADAGSYVGVVPLASPASIGDFGVRGASVYTQLVPSAQIESPMLDVRSNGHVQGLASSGGVVSRSVTCVFSPSQNLFLGSSVLPGSLSIVRDGISLRDSAGALLHGSTVVGSVDYASGWASLATALWGSSGAFALSLRPASVLDGAVESDAVYVSAESRSLSYVRVLGARPLPRSLVVSFLSNGRWFALVDGGDGVLKGADSSSGVGTVNYESGAVSVTLGALPDVGGVVLFQFASDQWSRVSPNAASVEPKAAFVLNLARAVALNGLSVSWSLNSQMKLAYDDGLGGLLGDATGSVDYSSGRVRLCPNVLPEHGTVALVDVNGGSPTLVSGLSVSSSNIGGSNVVPGSVRLRVRVVESLSVSATTAGGGSSQCLTTGAYSNVSLVSRVSCVCPQVLDVVDDGAGGLLTRLGGVSASMGSIVYQTGDLSLVAPVFPQGPVWSVVGVFVGGTVGGPPVTVSGGASYSPALPLSQAHCLSVSWDLDAFYEVSGSFLSGSPGSDALSFVLDSLEVQARAIPNATLQGVIFELGTTRFSQAGTSVYRDVSPSTGVGSLAGYVSGGLASVSLVDWPSGVSPMVLNWHGVVAFAADGPSAPYCASSVVFRTAQAPIRPGGVGVVGSMADGSTFNVSADLDGKFDSERVKGRVSYETGVVELYFVNPSGDSGYNVDLSHLRIPGLSMVPFDFAATPSIRYSAVAYSYLPMDASILGIDPVRLPSDGRVPIFRPGGFAVVGHSSSVTAVVSNGQTVDCARVRLARVRVMGADGSVIQSGFSVNLDAGTVTFSDVSSYVQPVTIEHRVEDMGVVRDVQITGEVTFTRPLTHDFPIGSFLSSALVSGDLKARVSVLFDQVSWTGVWSDVPVGSSATGTFNDVLAPVSVTNRGALSERWAVVFTSTTAFYLIGEHVGVVATGNVNEVFAPLNPATGSPYFSVPVLGWGGGWSVGNVLRFNTVGAMAPVWVVRTVQQGPNTGVEHSFALLVRGDVDRP